MKKFWCLFLAVVFIFVLYGCAENKNIKQSEDDYIKFWIDPKTGVQYVIYSRPKRGGITPRLNADGSLYVESEVQGDDD